MASQTRDEKAHRRRLGLTPIEGVLSSPEADRVRSRLKRMFDRQIRVSRSHGRFQVFLELWAGAGRVGAALRRSGWGTVSLDIRDGWEGDIMSPTVMSVLRGWITSNAVCGVFVNAPCETWGAYRSIFAEETRVGVRSPAHVAGRPGLNACARAKVKANNAYARRVAEIVRLGVRSFVPTLVTHPAHSLFWEFAPIRALAPCLDIVRRSATSANSGPRGGVGPKFSRGSPSRASPTDTCVPGDEASVPDPPCLIPQFRKFLSVP